MGRSILRNATRFSAAMLAIAVALFVAGRLLNPWDHHLSLTPTTHLALWPHGPDTSVVLYGDDPSGPYRGSIIGLGDAQGKLHNPPTIERGFDGPLIFHRHYEWPGSRIHTFAISLWYFILPMVILPMTWLVRRVTARRQQLRPDQASNT